MTTLADLLRRAKALIEDPRNWTQNTQRRKDTRVPGGYRYCAIGALAEAMRVGENPVPARDLLDECSGTVGIVTLNDTSDRPRRTVHAEVLEAFDCAIKKAEEA